MDLRHIFKFELLLLLADRTVLNACVIVFAAVGRAQDKFPFGDNKSISYLILSYLIR